MIESSEINHLLELARLQMSEDEKQKVTQDLNSILEYVNQLQKINTAEIEPMNGGTFFTNITRGDDVDFVSIDYSEELKQAALKRQGDYFEIPPIFD